LSFPLILWSEKTWREEKMHILGIDVGGSGIKGAVVDVEQGAMVTPRLRLATPQPATPAAVTETLVDLVGEFSWQGQVGCGFPAAMRNGVAATAANIDPTWIGFDVARGFSSATGCACSVINDADAAGLGEFRFGAGQERADSVLLLTLGTGIGSALFFQGRLFPNLELGSLPFKGGIAEEYAAADVRKRKKLSWKGWSQRLNHVLVLFERLLTPDLIIIGGGVSRKHEKFFPYLEARAELVPARLFNQAGIIGAAYHAAKQSAN
jgi:polyphosphate glucokinase